MTTAIDIRSVSRVFGRSRALDDVTLAVPEGSICGLLGRNGAGKTTIMSILAGQDRPSAGTVEVFGQNPFENRAALSGISFIRDNQRYPDSYRLHHVLRIAPEFAPNWNADIAAELVEDSVFRAGPRSRSSPGDSFPPSRLFWPWLPGRPHAAGRALPRP